MTKIRFVFAKAGEVVAELVDRNPRTREALLGALPFESSASVWGKEIYFSTPVSVDVEEGQEVVERGTVAYWPPGRALCLFFGPTPASRSEGEIRAASPVNVIGRVVSGLEKLENVAPGEKVRVELVE